MKPMRARHPLRLLAFAGALLLGPGCVNTVRIQVRSSAQTNDGEVFYMMVRATDDEALIAEDYATAANQVFTVAKEVALQKVQAIIPGKPLFLSVPRPTQQRLALYFFFTEPGRHWKVPLDAPIPVEVQVELGTHEVTAVEVRRQ
jgi:hypothetical protein